MRSALLTTQMSVHTPHSVISSYQTAYPASEALPNVLFKDARACAEHLGQYFMPFRAADTVRNGKEFPLVRIEIVFLVRVLRVDDFVRLRNERLHGGHDLPRRLRAERAVHEVALHIHNDEQPPYSRHFFSSLMSRSAI